MNASVLSNDSYQEFHGDFPWLFDDGRLIGGKPVPNVGWVFVARTPVRGEKSRKATKAKKGAAGRVGSSTEGKKKSARPSPASMKPMPVPKAPPPGATLPKKKAAAAPSARTVNEIIPFLQFVEKNPVGSVVSGKVESYSSHGAYVDLGEVRGYVPLRLMGDPQPRSARDVMALGDTVALEVVSVVASRRSIDLRPSDRKVSKKASASSRTTGKPTTPKPAPKKAVAKKAAAPKKAVAKKAAAPKKAAVKKAAAPKKAAVKKATASKKSAAPKK